MKVSVVVPIYNTKKYLSRCLDSLIAQKEEDIEIILVDDGSTDGSGRICDLYGERDRRIRGVHRENRGVSSARNLGMELLGGQYFCFIDSDDYVAPDYISVLLGNMDRTGSSVSVCGLSHKAMGGSNSRSYVLKREDALLSLFDSVKGIRGYIGGKLFKTDIMKRFGITFDEQQVMAEDLLFVFDYLQACPPDTNVCISECALYYYENKSGGVLTRRGSTDTFREEWYATVTACDKLLMKIPREDKSLRHAVEMERVMQCVTLIRIMAAYGLDEGCREYKKYVAKHLCSYLLSRSVSPRKKAGAAAVLICPTNIWKRR